jgi:hypothetical protein
MEKGIESFKASVMKDCSEGQNCFNENGCDHEFTRMVPQNNPKLLEMGITQSCKKVSKCFHKFCDKYKWVIDRANHYADKTGKTIDDVLKIWETDRSYWYMNFYQDCNQPILESESIIDYDIWLSQLKIKFGDDPKNWAFKCPSCGNIQNGHDFINNNIESPESKVYYSCIGRYVKGIGCDWTLGGLLKINSVSVMKDAQVFPVFEMADQPK